MKHPLASHLSLRSLATVVATLLGQALADGLDRAPILPKIAAAPARLRPAPPLRERDLAAVLTLARREFDSFRGVPPFSFCDFERRVRDRWTRRVRGNSHPVSTPRDTPERSAPTAPCPPEPS